jgi:Protein of unknown function (DUF1761)
MTIVLLTLAGVVISIIVGSLWYSPNTPMGKLHMRVMGFDKLSPEEQKAKIEAVKPHMWKSYLAQAALSLLNSFAVVIIVTFSMQNGLPFSMAAGFVAFDWLCFMLPVVGTNVIWSTTGGKLAWQKFISDAAYYFLTVILIAVFASFFV